MPDPPDYKATITEKWKNPQWRMAVIMFISFFTLFLWSMLNNIEDQRVYPINYSQFLAQLNANNIHSVTIKKLSVKGELREETPISLPGVKEPVSVKNFQTNLPSFQWARCRW